MGPKLCDLSVLPGPPIRVQSAPLGVTFPGCPQLKAEPDARLPITAIAELTQSDQLGFICDDCSGRRWLATRRDST